MGSKSKVSGARATVLIVASIAAGLVASTLAGSNLAAQTPSAAQFDVATVKRSPETGSDRININLGAIRHGKVTLGNASLADCLKFAYQIVSNSQLVAPDWVKSKYVRFDIVAQAPPDTPDEQIYVMLQNLLVDRLKITLHREQRELKFLALTAAKNGPKIHEVTPDPNFVGSFAGRGRIHSGQMSMWRLTSLLSRFEGQTIIDMTGLKGVYALALDWTPDDLPPEVLQRADPPYTGPSLATAVEQQLGLRLESRKANSTCS